MPDKFYQNIKDSIIDCVAKQEEADKETIKNQGKVNTPSQLSAQGSTGIGITSPSLGDIQNQQYKITHSGDKLSESVIGPQARDLYLIMRTKLIDQSKLFFEQHSGKDGQLNFITFTKWINRYPFIRTQVRESMCPRVWTLQPICAVPSSTDA